MILQKCVLNITNKSMKNNLRFSFTLLIVAWMRSSKGDWTPPENLLELCPYTSFCKNNISKQFPPEYSAKFAPCCRPCSCSETCGLYGNCCHRDFDKYAKEEKNEEVVCHSTIAPNVSRVPLDSAIYYKMIDKCPGKLSNSNSTFHPVYSPSKRMTYVNKQCAHCNNVTDGIDFQTAVICASEETFSDDAERFIHGKVTDANIDCTINFLPPKGVDLTFSKCEPDIIRNCNVTGMVSERDISWELCSEFNATFIDALKWRTLRYANIFCWMCNSRRPVNETMDIPFACPVSAVGGDESKQFTGMSLIVVMDMVRMEPQALQPKMVGQCLTSEVFITSFQSSCRPRRCPFGQIMLNNKCDFYSSQWYGGPFSFLVKLTPLNSEVIPMDFFSNMSVDIRRNNMATWLYRGALKTWQVLPLIQGTEDQTAVKYLITKVTYPYSSVNPLYLQEVLKEALKEEWMISYNGVQFRLKAELNKVLDYSPIPSEELKAQGIFTNQRQIFIPNYNLYTGIRTALDEYLSSLDLFAVKSFTTGVFLGQLFFCEQIDLEPEEYDFLYVTIFFKVSNKTIYDASFRSVKIDRYENKSSTFVESWTVRVCIDEFLDHFSTRENSCQILWSYNLIFLVLFYYLV